MKPRCNCLRCRLTRGKLREITPRLSRARESWFELRRSRRKAEDDLLRAERLLAHRELQIVRAGTVRGKRGTRWVHARQRKLEEAQRLVERYRTAVEELAA